MESRTCRLTGVALALAAAAFIACARERVEVGGTEDGADAPPVAPPPFDFADGGVDSEAGTCGLPPVIGRCFPCPNGYVAINGMPTCDCCPP